jgi:tight adherence protein B
MSTAGSLTAMLAAAIGWLALPPYDVGRLRTAHHRTGSTRRRRWWPLPAAVVGALGGWQLAPGGPLPVAVAGAAALLAGGIRLIGRQVRERRSRDERRRRVLELCDALSAELHAGLPAPTALTRACADWEPVAPVATAVRLGGDVTGTLRAAAEVAGAEGLASVAAAWEVAARSGAGLAVVVDRVTDGLRHEADAAAEVTAALGPPRATARMLLALPALGLGLGASMGADPLAFLLRTYAGVGCLLLGLLLALAGVWWVERLAAAAET